VVDTRTGEQEKLESPLTRKLTGPQFVDEQGIETSGMRRAGEESTGKIETKPDQRLEVEMDGQTYVKRGDKWINKASGVEVKFKRQLEAINKKADGDEPPTAEPPQPTAPVTPPKPVEPVKVITGKDFRSSVQETSDDKPIRFLNR
jgi:hypothetical protein